MNGRDSGAEERAGCPLKRAGSPRYPCRWFSDFLSNPEVTGVFGRMTSPRSRGISSDSTIPDPDYPETVGSNGIGSRRRRSSFAVRVLTAAIVSIAEREC